LNTTNRGGVYGSRGQQATTARCISTFLRNRRRMLSWRLCNPFHVEFWKIKANDFSFSLL